MSLRTAASILLQKLTSRLRRAVKHPADLSLKDKRMQAFSHENLEKLSDEHKLISMTIARLQQDPYYIRTYGAQTLQVAVNNLAARRLELEATIEVLTDHLN